jgi:hypothetical protein
MILFEKSKPIPESSKATSNTLLYDYIVNNLDIDKKHLDMSCDIQLDDQRYSMIVMSVFIDDVNVYGTSLGSVARQLTVGQLMEIVNEIKDTPIYKLIKMQM